MIHIELFIQYNKNNYKIIYLFIKTKKNKNPNILSSLKIIFNCFANSYLKSKRYKRKRK